MDIITHTLSGMAMGTLIAPFFRKSLRKKVVIVVCGALGGAFPDVDAISLWHRFDDTIGELFQLAQPGKEIYFSNHWYSHHNFFHSIMAAFLCSMVILALLSCCSFLWRSKIQGKFDIVKQNALQSLTFFLGYLAHLTGDLPTPAHVWGGIKLFWPLPTAIGGTGKIWWWNNYDIFLLVTGCCLLNIVGIALFHWYARIPFKYFVPFIVIASFLMILHQIEQRPVRFAYTGYTKKLSMYEQKSRDIQKNILGKKLYAMMKRIDDGIPVNF